MEIILSTRNPSKVVQISAVFQGLPVVIFSLDDAGILGEGIEDGETLEENSYKKAYFAWEQTRKWSMADDTGLYIDALGGEPGIKAARWAGEAATTDEIRAYTLQRLAHVPLEKRTATFKTVATLISPTGEKYFFEGEVKGILLTEPCTIAQPKMPYSSLFVPHGYTKTWAEMTTEEENEISHRGQAFRKVREFVGIRCA